MIVSFPVYLIVGFFILILSSTVQWFICIEILQFFKPLTLIELFVMILLLILTIFNMGFTLEYFSKNNNIKKLLFQKELFLINFILQPILIFLILYYASNTLAGPAFLLSYVLNLVSFSKISFAVRHYIFLNKIN